MNIVKKFENLINALPDDPEILEFIEDQMNYFPKYVNSVVAMQIHTNTYSNKTKDDNYLAKLKTLDETRRMIHESTISACNILNRQCKINNVELICDIDTSDRYAVADFAAEMVKEFFDNDRRYRNLSPRELVNDAAEYRDKIQSGTIKSMAENSKANINMFAGTHNLDGNSDMDYDEDMER